MGSNGVTRFGLTREGIGSVIAGPLPPVEEQDEIVESHPASLLIYHKAYVADTNEALQRQVELLIRNTARL